MKTPMIFARTLDEAKDAVKAVEQEGTPYVVSFLNEGDLRARLRRIRPDVLVTDADDTVIDGSGWAAVRAALPPNLRAHDERFLARFIHDSPWETPEQVAAQEGAWATADVHLMAQAGFTRGRIAEIGRSLPMREGVDALVARCAHVHYVSFGLAPLLGGWTAEHRLKGVISAADILFKKEPDAEPSDADEILCLDPMTIVTGGTKGTAMMRFLEEIKCDDISRVIAMGDNAKFDRRLWMMHALNVFIRQANGKARVERLVDDDVTLRGLTLIISDIPPLLELLDEYSR